MKTYLGKITVASGDYSTDCTIRFKTEGKPAAFLNRIAKNWYGSTPTKTGDGYTFDAGCVYVEASNWKAVSPEQYLDLAHFINEITL